MSDRISSCRRLRRGAFRCESAWPHSIDAVPPAPTSRPMAIDMHDQPVEIVTLRLAVRIIRGQRLPSPATHRRRSPPGTRSSSEREVWFEDTGFVADAGVRPRQAASLGTRALRARQSSSRWIRPPSCRPGAHVDIGRGWAICWLPLAPKHEAGAKSHGARASTRSPRKSSRGISCRLPRKWAATLIRTAFSPNIKERADCSTAIFDGEGRVIAQAQRVPIHLGSMIGAIDALRARFAPQDIRPGDMFVANDPYNGGGSHLPDINIIAPVLRDGAVVALSRISPITPTSAAWCRAAKPRSAARSFRKDCAFRRCASSRRARSTVTYRRHHPAQFAHAGRAPRRSAGAVRRQRRRACEPCRRCSTATARQTAADHRGAISTSRGSASSAPSHHRARGL